MKLAVRIFALSVVFAGAAAATVPSNSAQFVPSSLSATSPRPSPNSLPAPGWGLHVPMCFVSGSAR